MDTKTFSPAVLKLILEGEGLDQPGHGPKGSHGIAIGHGDDLGYQSAAGVADHWQPVLDHAASACAPI